MKQKQLIVLQASDEIMDIIDSLKDFDRGDLQGAIEAQLMKVYDQAKNNQE